MEKIRQALVEEIRAVRTPSSYAVGYIDDAVERIRPMIEEHCLEFTKFVEAGQGMYTDEVLRDMYETFLTFGIKHI